MPNQDKLSKKTLSYFSWCETNSEGNDEITVGAVGAYNEIDLSDEQAHRLIADWQEKLEAGQHITLHID